MKFVWESRLCSSKKAFNRECIPLYSNSQPRLWFKVEKATGKWASALYFACVRLIVLVWYPKLLKLYRWNLIQQINLCIWEWKKLPDGAVVKKYQINLKPMICPLLTRPNAVQGCQGCQKIQKTQVKPTLASWSAKIQPKFYRIQKTFRKQGFFDNFCSILMVFHSFFNFGWILALKRAKLVVRSFWHPWGHFNIGM